MNQYHCSIFLRISVAGGIVGACTAKDRQGDGQSDERQCGSTTDAGFRICCGAPSEISGVSCVDLTQDGGEFGAHGKCYEEGESFDGKFAGAQCCEGLSRLSPLRQTAQGCQPDGPPSKFICLACGDNVCAPLENGCTCADDCDVDGT